MSDSGSYSSTNNQAGEAQKADKRPFHASKYFNCPDGKDVPLPDMILRGSKSQKPVKETKKKETPATSAPAPVKTVVKPTIMTRQGAPQGALPDPSATLEASMQAQSLQQSAPAESNAPE
jgi:hypothetical protein